MLRLLYMETWSQSLWVVKALSVASDDSGPPGLGVGPIPVQQVTGNPPTGIPLLVSCCCSVWSFLDLRRLAATNTMTAMTTVPQIAALAAIVILSMLLDGVVTVRTSRHWLYGTVSGVTTTSSKEITHTTMHSWNRRRMLHVYIMCVKSDCCRVVDVTESTKIFLKFSTTLLPFCMVAMAVKMMCQYCGMADRCGSYLFFYHFITCINFDLLILGLFCCY